jgi:hypothetical protein
MFFFFVHQSFCFVYVAIVTIAAPAPSTQQEILQSGIHIQQAQLQRSVHRGLTFFLPSSLESSSCSNIGQTFFTRVGLYRIVPYRTGHSVPVTRSRNILYSNFRRISDLNGHTADQDSALIRYLTCGLPDSVPVGYVCYLRLQERKSTRSSSHMTWLRYLEGYTASSATGDNSPPGSTTSSPIHDLGDDSTFQLTRS